MKNLYLVRVVKMLPFDSREEQLVEVVISKDQLWGEVFTVLSMEGSQARKKKNALFQLV